MKKTIVQLLMLFAISLINLSCSKEKNPKAAIDEYNLTACPEGTTCQYLFTENADLNEEVSSPKTGPYRLFYSSVKTPAMLVQLYIKAPMQGNDFVLDKAAILSGRVKLVNNCANCLMATQTIVDGFVKGINLTLNKPADRTKWLLEIKVLLSGGDTIYVKQYFYPNFVYN